MEKPKPIITIITPTYSQGKFIAKTIESVLTQKGEFYIDYIILDAKSPDQTLEVIQQYEQMLKDNCAVQQVDGLDYYVAKDRGFKFNQCLGISYRWWSKPDKGQSDAINQGFKLAHGEILNWLNSDDYFTENAFANVIANQQATNADVITGNTIALNENDEALWLQRTGKPSLYALLYCREAPPQPATFFTRTALDKVGGSVDESLRYTMDTDLWLRLCYAGAKFVKIHDFLAVQVYQTESKSMEGVEMFAAFAPENKMLRDRYLQKLPVSVKLVSLIRLYLFHKPYIGLKNFSYAIPQPVKDVLNKMIAFITSH